MERRHLCHGADGRSKPHRGARAALIDARAARALLTLTALASATGPRLTRAAATELSSPLRDGDRRRATLGDRCDELPDTERLREERRSAERIGTGRDVAGARDENDGNVAHGAIGERSP